MLLRTLLDASLVVAIRQIVYTMALANLPAKSGLSMIKILLKFSKILAESDNLSLLYLVYPQA